MIDHPEKSEQELIELCQKKDGHAFDRLMRHYRIPLFHFLVRSCGEKELAEDLFQDTLIKVWRFLPGYKGRSAFSSWLFSVAHNVVRDALRRQKVRANISFRETVPDQAMAHTPADEIVADETRQLVEQALQALPEKQRQVFLLRQHSGMAFKEIAKVTGEPLNTVLSHMRYAVAKLKKCLRDDDLII